MSARVTPFHCPYCGEEDLWPHLAETDAESGSTGHGQWECRACQRAFAVRFLGMLARTPGSAGSGSEAAT